jgi:D-glycero-alpha-D-manno-heptose 1-phosphate guanylyltransferase
MDAVVLAGGFGTRLRAVVADVPKPMAPIGGRPFLEIVLSTLQRKGIDRAVLSVGYLADKIIGHFGQRFGGMELTYEVEDQPLGTGGAVAQALRRCRGDHVLVLNGDTYLDLEVAALAAAWCGAPIIVARQVDDTARYGRLEVDAGRVVTFAEKGVVGPGLINAGSYLLPVDLFRGAPPPAPFSLEADFLTLAVRERRFEVFVTEGLFIDIGIPEDFLRAQSMGLGALA